jgi:hypothetical protein
MPTEARKRDPGEVLGVGGGPYHETGDVVGVGEVAEMARHALGEQAVRLMVAGALVCIVAADHPWFRLLSLTQS